jgi:hypothetical protein
MLNSASLVLQQLQVFQILRGWGRFTGVNVTRPVSAPAFGTCIYRQVLRVLSVPASNAVAICTHSSADAAYPPESIKL